MLTIVLSYKELGLWSVVTLWQSLCILCQKAFQVQIKSCYTTTETDLKDGSSLMTWMQHLSGDLFGFFSCRNSGRGFCMIHLVITLTDCWFFFFSCDGATRVFVRFTSWYALVLHTLGRGWPAPLFDVTASHSQMFCGGHVVKLLRLHPPCCCCLDFWRCCFFFFSFYSSFGLCFGCRVAKQLLSVIWWSLITALTPECVVSEIIKKKTLGLNSIMKESTTETLFLVNYVFDSYSIRCVGKYASE